MYSAVSLILAAFRQVEWVHGNRWGTVRGHGWDALNNLGEIILASDYLLIDRDDFSKELPIEKIPFAQKIVLNHANVADIPVL